MQKLVSVIVTTKNEEAMIERLLQSVKKQSYRKTELIVVDNRSTDKTKKLAKQFTNLVYTAGPERSAQRNFGAKKAKGDYLLFLDADMELEEDVVTQCVKSMEKSQKIQAVIVAEKPVAERFWEKVKAFERSIYNKQGDDVTDAARFFSKKVFKEVGGYDETITGPEDWDLPENILKKGYKITRVKPKILHYERIPSLFSLLKKKYYYGLKSYRYLAKNKISVISPKTIYFLRPIYYQNLDLMIKHPLLFAGMMVMLVGEQFSGGMGFLVGKVKYK